MKRILLITSLLISLMVVPIQTRAAGFSTQLSGPTIITQGQAFTVKIILKGATNIIAVTSGLSYDKSKLTITGSGGSSGYTLTLGTKIVVDNTTGKSGDFQIAYLSFKPTAAFTAGQSTAISISNITGSNGTSDIVGTGSTLNVSVAVPKATNNYLSSLTVSSGSINFNKTTTAYSLTVENSVANLTVGAKAEDPTATVSGAKSYPLAVYGNTIKVTVTAQSGAQRVYTLTVKRKDELGNLRTLGTNNLLQTLTIEGQTLAFNPTTDKYNLEVDNLTTKLNISATAQDENSKIVTNNISELKVGENTITIVVTPEKGDPKTYTVIVTRSNQGPKTTLEEAVEVLEKTTADSITIRIADNPVISTEILQKLIETKKDLYVEKREASGQVRYTWTIPGKSMSETTDINTELKFESINQAKINELSNYASGIVLSFSHKGSLPKGTKVKINVGNMYPDGSIINLYYFNAETQKLESISTGLEVVGGFVELELSHASDYLLTQSTITAVVPVAGISIWQILAIVEGMLLILSLGLLVFRKKDKQPRINNAKSKHQTAYTPNQVRPVVKPFDHED